MLVENVPTSHCNDCVASGSPRSEGRERVHCVSSWSLSSHIGFQFAIIRETMVI